MLQDHQNGSYTVTPWKTMAMAAATLVYVVNPFDVVPDVIVGLGLVDDASLVAVTLKSLGDDLCAYCRHKGIDPAAYGLAERK